MWRTKIFAFFCVALGSQMPASKNPSSGHRQGHSKPARQKRAAHGELSNEFHWTTQELPFSMYSSNNDSLSFNDHIWMEADIENTYVKNIRKRTWPLKKDSFQSAQTTRVNLVVWIMKHLSRPQATMAYQVLGSIVFAHPDDEGFQGK